MIKEIRAEVEQLFPKEAINKAGTYVTREWIFPNHLDPMIAITKRLCSKYGGDEEICELACLLHDIGLVVGRDDKSPEGHEERSLLVAKELLTKHKATEETTTKVLECIKATEVDFEPKTVNEKIVRTADIMSQYLSIHFFAKAHFYERWDWYMNFFEKKVIKGFDKIAFEDERKEMQPIKEYYTVVLKEYHSRNN